EARRRAAGLAARIATGGSLTAWSALLVVGLVQAVRGAGGVAGPGTLGRELALEGAVAAIRDRVPPGRVVGAPEFWAIVHLRTGHPVVPSVRFRPGSGTAAVGSPEELHRLWAVGRVGTLLDEGGLHRAGLEALDAVCGPTAWAVVATGPGFQLVDLTWDV